MSLKRFHKQIGEFAHHHLLFAVPILGSRVGDAVSAKYCKRTRPVQRTRFLRREGYDVFGLTRSSSGFITGTLTRDHDKCVKRKIQALNSRRHRRSVGRWRWWGTAHFTTIHFVSLVCTARARERTGTRGQSPHPLGPQASLSSASRLKKNHCEDGEKENIDKSRSR
jgi:hypothetical protein